MTPLTALTVQLCSTCQDYIQIGEEYVVVDDEPVHVECE